MRLLPKLVCWIVIGMVIYTFVRGTQIKDLNTVMVIMIFLLAAAVDNLYKMSRGWHFRRPITSIPEARKLMDNLVKDLEQKIKDRTKVSKLRNVKNEKDKQKE